ncbi:hypothetical protein QQS21_003858 [Conoideocrella luteorostrata]|uniref:Uncharacterized protein n=1 Tax=Conoideocrella luteorostrata TaxID=1105319 RepID=A0AAJ0CSK5_9HYPO|nr:hypothetical protein QQS21_003858 [Conoideocrella luteorostrata]
MCDHSEKGAIELLLSEENRSQLKDLGYEDAAKPILLNDFPESKDGCAQIRSQTWQVDASKAMEILTNASRTRTSNNAVLEVLASLIIHRDPLRPNLATGRFEVKENILVQRDLAQALTSISLCRTESRGQQSDALIAEAGLACLALLLYKSQPLTLTNLTLIHVIAYTDPSNCWTTRPAALLAEHILYLQISTKDIPSFTTGAILIDFIRPELPLSHSYATPASDQTELSLLTLDDTEDHEKTIVILKWAIEKAEEVYIARHWHHFTPALLRLAESRDTTVRLKALEAIIMFLKKCPSSTIYATGISYILENTILPTLLLLPPLTPERDSVALLDVGYQAIINLAAKSSDRRSYSRRQLLDTAIREGIMIGYHHAPGYTLIVKVLMQSTAKLVSCLGIFSVKHLTVSF